MHEPKVLSDLDALIGKNIFVIGKNIFLDLRMTYLGL